MKIKNYLLMLAAVFVLFSCEDDENDSPSTNNNNDANEEETITIESSQRIVGKINGEDYSKVFTSSGEVLPGVGISGAQATFPDTSYKHYSCWLNNADYTITFFDLTKSTLAHVGGKPENEDFLAFFAPGSYPFTANLDSTDGVVIVHYDENETRWSTTMGSQDQSGSSFEITDAVGIPSELGDYRVKIKAEFNCTLYNASGQSMEFTEGVYVNHFANI